MRRLLPLLALAVAAGCQSEGDGMSANDVKMAEDVNAWAKSSNGDWSKLTPEQQAAMIKDAGDEATAKKVLEMKAHPPQKPTPGPPANMPTGR